MQAIQTKVIPATNTKPTRIMSKCARGKCFFSTTHLTVEVGSVEAHREAAQALVARFIKEDEKQFGTTNNPWAKPFVTGCLPDGSMAHVWPHVETSILIQAKDANDAKYIRNYKTDADQRDGTVTGVSNGLMCSALKRATI